MNTSSKFDKDSLIIQLENYETFLQLYPHLVENDRLLKEHISHRMGMLQSAIAELELLEITDAQEEYEQSLDRANRILQGVKALIEYMLNPNNPSDGSFRSVS